MSRFWRKIPLKELLHYLGLGDKPIQLRLVQNMITLFLNETHRLLALWRSYRWSTVSSFVVHLLIFPVLMLLFDNLAVRYGSSYGQGRQLQSLIGFLVWHLCMKVMVAIPTMVEEEAVLGTLENVVLASGALLKTIVLRTIVISFRFGVETLLLGLVLSKVMGLTLPFSASMLLVTLLLLVSTCGVGLTLAGLALLYKSVRSVTSVIGNLALLLSGALVPLDGLGNIFVLLKYIFPMTWGITTLRKLAVSSNFLHTADLAGLTLQAMIMLGVGMIVFSNCLQRARVQGTLATH